MQIIIYNTIIHILYNETIYVIGIFLVKNIIIYYIYELHFLENIFINL